MSEWDTDESSSFEFNDLGLKKLAKAFSEENMHIKIGVLGPGEAREDGGKTNAQIGAIHEFNGRSFLRMPILNHFSIPLMEAGAFDEETLKKIKKEGTLEPWMKKVAIIAENVIQKAFDTGGYGKWPKSNMKYKKIKLTLVETTQLRKSITSTVEK